MPPVVIFDGTCSLCIRSVAFILEHESDHALRFAPLQYAGGARLMRELGLDVRDARTFVLVEQGRAYVRSDAALRVARHFRWPWRSLRALWIVPRPIRELAYDLVARNRHRWFGRQEACMVPSADIRERFME